MRNSEDLIRARLSGTWKREPVQITPQLLLDDHPLASSGLDDNRRPFYDTQAAAAWMDTHARYSRRLVGAKLEHTGGWITSYAGSNPAADLSW